MVAHLMSVWLGLEAILQHLCSKFENSTCFTSDLDTAQRILLQNFITLTETVFFQEPRFFGGLRHSQKEESRLKINHAAEGLNLQEPMKMSIEY
ncbi:hypothetical protein NQ318_023024, partial [Aromia moschata]